MLAKRFEHILHDLGMAGLEHPLFYHAPVGIRFKIGGEEPIYLDRRAAKLKTNPAYVQGALGVNHQLVRKGILVQSGCGGQVVRPAFPVPGQAVGCALGKGEIFFGFAWHFGLLPFLSIKIAGNRFGAARWKVY